MVLWYAVEKFEERRTVGEEEDDDDEVDGEEELSALCYRCWQAIDPITEI